MVTAVIDPKDSPSRTTLLSRGCSCKIYSESYSTTIRILDDMLCLDDILETYALGFYVLFNLRTVNLTPKEGMKSVGPLVVTDDGDYCGL